MKTGLITYQPATAETRKDMGEKTIWYQSFFACGRNKFKDEKIAHVYLRFLVNNEAEATRRKSTSASYVPAVLASKPPKLFRGYYHIEWRILRDINWKLLPGNGNPVWDYTDSLRFPEKFLDREDLMDFAIGLIHETYEKRGELRNLLQKRIDGETEIEEEEEISNRDDLTDGMIGWKKQFGNMTEWERLHADNHPPRASEIVEYWKRRCGSIEISKHDSEAVKAVKKRIQSSFADNIPPHPSTLVDDYEILALLQGAKRD